VDIRQRKLEDSVGSSDHAVFKEEGLVRGVARQEGLGANVTTKGRIEKPYGILHCVAVRVLEGAARLE
jgi:hypothetical protein